MELRYCEECGDVIQLDTDEPLGLNDTFVCASCQGLKAQTRSKATKKASPQQRAARMRDLVPDGELELFSQQTIAVRKKALSTSKPSASKPSASEAAETSDESAGLRLVQDSSSAGPGLRLTDGEETASPPTQASSGASGSQKQRSVRLEARPESTGRADPATGKIIFRCCHCQRSLAIRPVTKMSKLACPGCRGELFVTADGRLLTASGAPGQGAGSFVVRQADSVRILKERPGSAPARKEGSLSLRLSETSTESSSKGPAPTEKLPSLGRARSARGGSVAARGSSRRDVESCRLRSANPNEVTERPPSAFEEHQNSEDPSKTLFISEETTKSLESSLSLSELAAAVPPRPKSTRKAGPGSKHRKQPSSIVRRSGQEPRGKRTKKASAKPNLFGVALRALLLTGLLSAPVVFTGSLLTQTVLADGRAKGEQPPYVLENLGRICAEGVRHLFGENPDAILNDGAKKK